MVNLFLKNTVMEVFHYDHMQGCLNAQTSLSDQPASKKKKKPSFMELQNSFTKNKEKGYQPQKTCQVYKSLTGILHNFAQQKICFLLKQLNE